MYGDWIEDYNKTIKIDSSTALENIKDSYIKAMLLDDKKKAAELKKTYQDIYYMTCR